MHIHGAPKASPAERTGVARPGGTYATGSGRGSRNLFQQPSDAPAHVAETASSRPSISPERLSLLSKSLTQKFS